MFIHLYFIIYYYQDLLLKACANLAFFMWTHELLPMDILLLALTDRDDDPYALHIVVFYLIFFSHKVNFFVKMIRKFMFACVV